MTQWNEEVRSALRKIADQYPEQEDFDALIRVKDLRAALDRIAEFEQLEFFTTPDCLALSNMDHRLNDIKEKADILAEVIEMSAPTGWAAAGDLVEASEWEKLAVKAINEYEAVRFAQWQDSKETK